MNKSSKFSPEVRERAVRMVHEHRGEYPSPWAAVESIASKIGCVPRTLLEWVNRQFQADRPNQLWVSDFTYVSTWRGWLYVAFVIDVFARRIVGWRVSTSMTTDFVLDALEQAPYARQPDPDALIHHSDQGSQYVSIRYSERLAEAGIEPSGDHQRAVQGGSDPSSRPLEDTGVRRAGNPGMGLVV